MEHGRQHLTHLHVVVRGRVQRVGFRWFVRETARRLGVGGWVRNNADGSLQVAAEGDDSVIEALRQSLWTGPEGASVEAIDDLAPIADSLPRPFTILR
jgi:acylphosphatase